MRLEQDADRFVVLEVVAYEFGQASGEKWDDNWLVVRGHVVADGLRWHFREPCLLTDEASRLGRWLRRVAREDVPAVDFLEPNLALGVAGRSPDAVTIALTLRAESFPPGVDDAQRWSGGHAVALTLSPDTVVAAADAWLADLERFPRRA
jgi:hypothetical protein